MENKDKTQKGFGQSQQNASKDAPRRDQKHDVSRDMSSSKREREIELPIKEKRTDLNQHGKQFESEKSHQRTDKTQPSENRTR